MGKEADPLPRGVRMAVAGLRLFSSGLLFLVVAMGVFPLVGLCLYGVELREPWWALDALAVIVFAMLLICFSMRTFADGLEQAHRCQGGITDTLRWLKFSVTAAGWMKWIAVGLLLASVRLAAGKLMGETHYQWSTVLIVWIVRAILLAGMISLSRTLKRRFQEELALRPLAEPIGSRKEAPPMLPDHLPPPVSRDE